MSRPWEVVLHEDAVSFLLSCRSVERNKVLRFIEQLRESPTLPGHFEERDDAGHVLQVRLHGSHLVTYWPDQAVKEVRVVNIERND